MRPTPSLTRRTALAAVAGRLARAGSRGGGDTGQPDAADAATPTEAAPEGGPDGADGAVVAVELIDFAFSGLPGTVERGTRLEVTNGAERELHELVAFALPEDEERSVDDLAALPADELLGVLGEPSAVLLAAPGGPQIPAVGDGTLTEPGRYVIACFIPSGIEPQVYLDAAAEGGEGPPQVGGGPPHLVHGMYAELEVT